MAPSPATRTEPSWPAPLLAVARFGLGAPTAGPPGPLDPPAWQALLRDVQRERLTGLLAAATGTGALAATDDQQREALAAHRHAAVLSMALEGMLVATIAVLERAGIDHRVLKGPAVARLDHAEPELRCFTDVDLLVRSGDLDAAIRALGHAGFVRAGPELRDGFDRRFGKGATLFSADGLPLDLHRTLDRGPFGMLVVLDDLWEPPVAFGLAGAELRALPTEQRLLSVCFHAALGDVPPRLGPLRDVAELLLGARVDDDRVRELARRWQSEAVLARALLLTSTTLALPGGIALVEWALARRTTPWEARLLDLYLDPAESHLARALAMLRLVRGARAKAAYARAIAFPGADYLSDRGRTRLRHWGLLRMPWRRIGDDHGNP